MDAISKQNQQNNFNRLLQVYLKGIVSILLSFGLVVIAKYSHLSSDLCHCIHCGRKDFEGNLTKSPQAVDLMLIPKCMDDLYAVIDHSCWSSNHNLVYADNIGLFF